MQGKYSVALIGCGQRGREHAAGVRADARCEVVALVDVNPEAAARLAGECGFESASRYVNHMPMLAEHRPDIVVISLWTELHLPVFRDVANTGTSAVMCEKPMALNWADSTEMAAIARQTGCRLTFCHQRRFARGNRWMRQQLADGRFGEIERMDLYSPKHLLDCGTHSIDQAMSFNHESPPKWVLGGIDAGTLVNFFGVRAEAMAVGTIVFQNGVRASLQAGGPDMDLWGGVRVTGSKGFAAVTWDGQIKRAMIYDDAGWQAPADFGDKPVDHMTAMVHDLIDCMDSGRESELSVEAALPVTGAIFGLYESVRRHRRIDLPLTGVCDNPFVSMLDSGAFA